MIPLLRTPASKSNKEELPRESLHPIQASPACVTPEQGAREQEMARKFPARVNHAKAPPERRAQSKKSVHPSLTKARKQAPVSDTASSLGIDITENLSASSTTRSRTRVYTNRGGLPIHDSQGDGQLNNKKYAPPDKRKQAPEASSDSEFEFSDSPPKVSRAPAVATSALSESEDESSAASPKLALGRPKRRRQKSKAKASPASPKNNTKRMRATAKQASPGRAAKRRANIQNLRQPFDPPPPLFRLPDPPPVFRTSFGGVADTYREYDGTMVNVDEVVDSKGWQVEELLDKEIRADERVYYLCKWEDTWETKGMYRALKNYKTAGYKVKILRRRRERRGNFMVDMVLCRWKPLWEPQENIENSLIADYERKIAAERPGQEDV